MVGSEASNSEVWDLLVLKTWSSHPAMLSIDISQIDLNAICMHPLMVCAIEDLFLEL